MHSLESWDALELRLALRVKPGARVTLGDVGAEKLFT